MHTVTKQRDEDDNFNVLYVSYFYYFKTFCIWPLSKMRKTKKETNNNDAQNAKENIGRLKHSHVNYNNTTYSGQLTYVHYLKMVNKL
jgi:hypothetical protein